MIKRTLLKPIPSLALRLLFMALAGAAVAQSDRGSITITKQTEWEPGREKPTLVSLSGFTGEVDSALRFDLYVQGFNFVAPGEAEFLIRGSNAGNVQGEVKARLVEEVILPQRRYVGTSLRRQAHAFADDIVQAIRGEPGIARTRIACKVDQGSNTEIVVSDIDGGAADSVTRTDNALAKSPAWAPDGKTLYYSSYKRGPAEIFRHDTKTGARVVVAAYGGSNLMPAPSPDGSKFAMVLSKSGMVDLYVANADGSNLKQLTKTREDESSPCWSPDGRWICFATKIGARRVLAKVSPDGGWIAFTAQMGNFELCVVPSQGGEASILVSGEDPSWAPNSRTLAFARRAGSRITLSLLDVPTKQFKDVARISGNNNSQPAWAR